jgi:PKD repeat protein
MMNHIAKSFTAFIGTIVLLTFFSHSAHSQVATTGIQGGTLCPNTVFSTPVLVTGLDNIDSISLILNFPAQTLSYTGFQFANILVRDSIKVEGRDSSLIITWKSDNPVTLGDTTLLELKFITGTENGVMAWDSVSSYYHSAIGDTIELTLTGDDITILPAMTVEIQEINKTCADECDANIVVIVSGGTAPFEYLWNGVPMDVNLDNAVKKNACGGNNLLKITDSNNCVLDSVFVVSELPAIDIEIETSPDTVYLQNPVVKFSFTEDQSIVEWLWDFGDGSEKSIEQSPVHTYPSAIAVNSGDSSTYEVKLKVINSDGCEDEIVLNIPVAEVVLFIPNVFTPPTDPNGFFRIAKKNDGGSSGSEYVPIVYEYQRMELFVFDRWGRKVYDNSNYKNDWDGDNLPDGTYFYKLNTFGFFQDKSYTGAVTIIREK